MKTTERITKLLSRTCGQCGSCCCEPIIELTHHDLRRLVNCVNISADHLIKLYDSSELNPDGEDNDWITLSYGKRKLGLRKKRNGECIFLSENRQCAAYEARPLSCRIFPVDVILDENHAFIDLEISEIIKTKFVRCKSKNGRPKPLKQFRLLANQAQAETVSYWKKLSQWNHLPTTGRKSEFLEFLVHSSD